MRDLLHTQYRPSAIQDRFAATAKTETRKERPQPKEASDQNRRRRSTLNDSQLRLTFRSKIQKSVAGRITGCTFKMILYAKSKSKPTVHLMPVDDAQDSMILNAVGVLGMHLTP
jgi:hypothetical protein